MLVIVLQALTVGLLFTSFSFWVDPWVTQFDVERSDVMLIATLYSLVVGAAGPVAGSLIDRIEARKLISSGLAALGAGCLLISLATELWHVMAVYVVLMPLAMSLAGPIIAQALAARWFPDRSGFAIGLSTLGTSLGGVVLPILVTALIETSDWRQAHGILTILIISVIPVVWFVLSSNPTSSPTSDKRQASSPTVSVTAMLRSPSTWILVLLFSPMYFTLAGFQYNVAPFANDEGVSPARAAMMVSAMSVTMMCGKIFFGWLMDKFDHRYVYSFSVGGLAGSLFLLAITPTAWVIPVVALLGFFGGGILPIKGALALDRFGAEYYGRAVGILMPFLMCAAALAPLVVGWTREYIGSYAQVFVFLGWLLLPGLVLVWLSGKKRAHNQ